MKIAKILIACVIILSCKTQALKLNSPSIYRDVKDNRFIIQFTSDSDFVIEGRAFETHYGCVGKWRYIGDHKIVLKCGEIKDPLLAIEPGYMKERDHIIEMLSNSRIKYENRILKRVKYNK